MMATRPKEISINHEHMLKYLDKGEESIKLEMGLGHMTARALPLSVAVIEV